jgi:hypothetical protein
MQQVVDFVLELDKLKGVLRKVRPLGLDRHENSIEYSWQLLCWLFSLGRYAEGPLDINRVMRCCWSMMWARLTPRTLCSSRMSIGREQSGGTSCCDAHFQHPAGGGLLNSAATMALV